MSSDAAPTVVVALKDDTGEMVRFRVKPTMKMGRLLDKYEKHKGVGLGTFRFLIDGVRLPPSEDNENSVQKYLDDWNKEGDNDEDDDEGYDFLIECCLQQVGGSKVIYFKK